MNKSPVSKKEFIIALCITILVLSIKFSASFLEDSTKIVFCDVGQGDGVYLRIHNRFDVMIDAGPDRKILNCLGRYMPFYDRNIELAFISHDQKDHFGGFNYLLDRYNIQKIFIPDIETSLQSFKRLKRKMKEKKISLQTIYTGTHLKIMNDLFVFYWPREHCIASNNNDCSLIFTFGENDFKVLFAGDASAKVLNSMLKEPLQNISVLKVPHHGSKNGLTETFLRLADPAVAVISAGKKNAYGHPSKEVLDMLESHKVKIRRTDTEGNIVFKLSN